MSAPPSGFGGPVPAGLASTSSPTQARIRDDPNLSEQTRVGEGGVGLIFVEGVESNRIAVLTVVNGGPAQRDGTIRAGDLIAAVDGRGVIGMPLNEIRKMILGPTGTRVTLTFDSRNGRTRSYTVALVREEADSQAAGERALRMEREIRARMEAEYKREISVLHAELERLQAELHGERNNQSRLDQEQSQRFRRDMANARKELEEVVMRLEHELATAKDDAARFKASSSELENRCRVAEAEARAEAERRAALEAEFAQLRHQFENDRTQLGMRGEYEKVLTVMTSKLQARTDDLHAEALRRERAEEDLARLHEEMKRYHDANMIKDENVRTLTQQHMDNENKLMRDAQDRGEQLRAAESALRHERDNRVRMQADLKQLEGELRATRESLGDHRRTLASIEARLASATEENMLLNAKLSDAAAANRQSAQEILRLTSDNGRLTSNLQELSSRLDAAERLLNVREEEKRAIRRDMQALGAELEATRMREAKMLEDLRTLERIRADDRRNFDHQADMMEAKMRTQLEDNRALATMNEAFAAELTHLRTFAEAAHTRDMQEAVNVERHLLRLHSAADQMHSSLAGVVEAKRILTQTRGRLPPPPSLLPPGASQVGTSIGLQQYALVPSI